MSNKSIVVLIIDHDTFNKEKGSEQSRTKKFDVEDLVYIGRQTNEASAGWYGYEGWMVVHDIPEKLLDQLNKLNIPVDPE